MARTKFQGVGSKGTSQNFNYIDDSGVGDGPFAVVDVPYQESGTALTVTPASVGIASAQVYSSSDAKKITFHNPSATASIALRPAGAAALNTAGNIQLGPGQTFIVTGVLATQSWFAIATAAATPLTAYREI